MLEAPSTDNSNPPYESLNSRLTEISNRLHNNISSFIVKLIPEKAADFQFTNNFVQKCDGLLVRKYLIPANQTLYVDSRVIAQDFVHYTENAGLELKTEYKNSLSIFKSGAVMSNVNIFVPQENVGIFIPPTALVWSLISLPSMMAKLTKELGLQEQKMLLEISFQPAERNFILKNSDPLFNTRQSVEENRIISLRPFTYEKSLSEMTESENNYLIFVKKILLDIANAFNSTNDGFITDQGEINISHFSDAEIKRYRASVQS